MSDAPYRGGRGEPLVLLHGASMSWRAWRVAGIVDDVETLMDRAGMPTAHLAGNSLGGWVALEMARRGRARSVVALPCPVRVAWSGRDRLIPWPRHGRPLRERLPGAEFVRLPRVGHVPMWDDPDLVVRAVLGVTAAARDVPEETPA